MQQIDWHKLMYHTLRQLPITTEQFWGLTFCELTGCLDKKEEININKEQLSQLIQQFKDSKNV
jgi:hypothetical protein